MKIGILTQPLLRNYGGVLQNYALHVVLRRLGHDPLTLNYWDGSWMQHILEWGPHFCRTVIPRLCGHKERRFLPWPRRPLTRAFSRFIRQNIAATDHICAYTADLIDQYALGGLIVGSDQTWRPLYNKATLGAMYLDFAADREGVRRVAYAASFGVDTWEYTPDDTEWCRRLAKRFDAVSVREASGVMLCRDYLGRTDAVHVLDPTLLLRGEDYHRLCVGVTVRAVEARMKWHPAVHTLAAGRGGTGYCLAFLLDVTAEKKNFVRTMATAHSLPVAYVIRDMGNIVLSIEEWLVAFSNASLIVTDSFHGTVFSILFGRDFLTIGNRKRGLERITSLLALVGLSDRLVLSDSLMSFDSSCVKPINVQAVDERLMPMRQKSVRFLEDALK